MVLVAALLFAAGAADHEAPKVEHTPLAKAQRGSPPVVEALITDPSGVFGPQVLARPGGAKSYNAYPMQDQGGGRFVAELPRSLLVESEFQYFVEAYDNAGNGPARAGTPERPFVVSIVDPPPQLARASVRTEPPGADVTVDGRTVGQSPLSVELTPGAHVIGFTAAGRRGAEHRLELAPGRDLDLFVALAEKGGPGSLRVVSDPPGAAVLLDGDKVGVTPYQDRLAPGAHRVAVEMEGHLRQARDATFEEGRDVEMSFVLPPLPKEPALSVQSEPPGAALVVDGELKGVTPWVGPLAKGPHQVLLRMEGRREVATDFVMPEERDLGLRLSLPEAGSKAPQLTVTSAPKGATVTVDGLEVGQTPWRGEVKPGGRKVAVSLPGHLPEQRTAVMRPSRDLEVNFSLQREPGPARLRVETDPAGAEVLVDGESLGRAPYGGDLAPGEHSVEARIPGYRGVAQQLLVEAGQQLSLRLALAPVGKAPEPPVVSVVTEPRGAEVLLDRKPKGTTPVKVETTPGPHELRVSLEGYQPRDSKFTLPDSRDFELRLAIALKPLRAAVAIEQTDPRELARAQLKRARACYVQGDWVCALGGFQAAYEFKPLPELLFNIAQARRKKGDYAEAAEAYRAYVRDAPQAANRNEAESLAAQCDEQAQGAAAAPAVEDTQPPALEHKPVASATRAAPLRLAARITDDRSGIFSPQACWRNLYTTEYECAPLVSVGRDEYGVEVPARAVTDGFAYLLETFDNAGNGPARSGAPELPHTVAIEEAAPAPPASEPPRVETAPAPVMAAAAPAPAPAVAPEATALQLDLSKLRRDLSKKETRGGPVLAWVFLGLGAASGAGGGVAGYFSSQIFAQDRPTVQGGVRAHTITEVDAERANQLAWLADGLFGLAGALAVAGVISFVVEIQ